MILTPTDDEMVSWLKTAYKKATESPDPSTQNGACLYSEDGYLIGAACNTLLRGIDVDLSEVDRETKLNYIQHAERGAIGNSSRSYVESRTIKGSPHVLVACWAACLECAKAISGHQIPFLVRHKRPMSDRWQKSIEVGDEILRAGGVTILEFDGKLFDDDSVSILFDGEVFYP